MLPALIVFLAGFGLGTRFTVFALIPFGVAVVLSCLAVGLVQHELGMAMVACAGLIASINVGYLVGRLCRMCVKSHLFG